MQRIEFRLIYFPEEQEWRLYSGESYRTLGKDLRDLYSAISKLLFKESKDLHLMAEQIVYNNPQLAEPTTES